MVGHESHVELFGMVGFADPVEFLGGWGIVDPIGFLVEGGIFSLECPRATAVFGQTVLVWSGVPLVNFAFPT